MFSLSNGLSLLRAPLALLFLQERTEIRLIALFLAMLTDAMDGFLARKRRSATQFGAILDPAMDKLFAFTVLAVFFSEGHIELWEVMAMLSRDFALCFFALYLALSGQWQTFQFKAIRWGKVTTALQFFILIMLTFNLSIPGWVYSFFILFGLLALAELLQMKKQASTEML